jgi:hypothetical protein
MKTFRIIADLDERRFSQAGRSLAQGVIPLHVSAGDVSFPSSDWDDFGVVILGWWLREFGDFMRGDQAVAVLRFMDGPYEIEISRGTLSDACVVRCVRRQGEGRHDAVSCEVPADRILREIVRASRAVLAAYRRRGLWNKDCETLARCLPNVG